MRRISSSLLLLLLGALPVLAGNKEEVPIAVGGAVLIENSPPRPWVVVLPLAGRARVGGPLEVTPGVPAHLDLPADGDALLCGGADGCATSCRVTAPGDELTRLPLVTGARVRGRCVVGRSPARDAQVFLRPAVLESRRPVALPLFRDGSGELVTNVLTDAGGAFELEHVAPGKYVAEVHLRDGRIHESEVLVIEDEPDVHSPLVRELPLIQIPEGLRTVVTVRDRDGAPVAGAGVGLMQRRGQTVVFTAETVTDSDGLAEVSGWLPTCPSTRRAPLVVLHESSSGCLHRPPSRIACSRSSRLSRAASRPATERPWPPQSRSCAAEGRSRPEPTGDSV